MENPEPTTQPKVPGTPEQTPEPKKTFPIKWLSLGVGFVLILIVLTGTFFLGQKSVTKVQEKTLTQTTPTATPDPTASWNTYTGTAYNFKYPTDWNFINTTLTSTIQVEEFRSPDYKETQSNEPGVGISTINKGQVLSIRIETNPNFKTYQNYKNFMINQSTGSFQRNDPNRTEIQVNRNTCLFSSNLEWFGGYASACSMYVNGETYDLTFRSKEKDYKLFDKILSTFKFTDQNSQTSQSFLEIPELGIKLALTDTIKDAYYITSPNSKDYVYLKVHSLDNEPQCKKDDSSTASVSRVGKDDINPMSQDKYSNSYKGVTIGNYFYYTDLAQYECAQSVTGKANLEQVRKAFTNASTSIEKL